MGRIILAKLNGVKTLDMVNGEITAIEYDGAVYSKVDGGSEHGDILLRINGRTPWATIGSYYLAVDNGEKYKHFIDDTEQPCGLHDHLGQFAHFRKASESPQASTPFAEMVMAKVDAVNANVKSLERKVAAIEAKMAPETLVKGDRVLISGSSKHGVDADGKIGKFLCISEGGSDVVSIDGGDQRLFRRDQLTKVAGTEAPAQPKTGDIVVITANTNLSNNIVGDIGKVEDAPSNDAYSVKVQVPGGPTYSVYTKFSEMRLATPAEIEKYEASLVQIAKDTVFTEAGRKPNEYRRGDVVRVLDTLDTIYLDVGQVTEVVTQDGTDAPNVRSNDGGTRYAKVEIVCFAENRADLTNGAC